MTYKIYCVEGPDESCLFDDPEKGYEDDEDAEQDITQKINISEDELDDDKFNDDDDIDDDEDTADDEEV